MKKIFSFFAIAAVVLGMASCNGNDPETPSVQGQDEKVEYPHFQNPSAWSGTFAQVSHIMQTNLQQPNRMPARFAGEGEYPIYNVMWTDGTWPVTIEADYGPFEITGVDGLAHTGSIDVHATNFFEARDSEITPTFNSYCVYGANLHGSQRITNKGKNGAGHLVFEVTVEQGRLGSGSEFVYSENTTRELIAGLDDEGWLSKDFSTHLYHIRGTMTGISNVDSIPGYTITIDRTNPMVIQVGDMYPMEGHLHVVLTKPFVYKVDQSKLPEILRGVVETVSFEECELYFSGHVQGYADVYGAEVETSFTVTGYPTPIPCSIYFELDKNGVIPESIVPSINLNS